MINYHDVWLRTYLQNTGTYVRKTFKKAEISENAQNVMKK